MIGNPPRRDVTNTGRPCVTGKMEVLAAFEQAAAARVATVRPAAETAHVERVSRSVLGHGKPAAGPRARR